jgi:hypothetical protein
MMIFPSATISPARQAVNRTQLEYRGDARQWRYSQHRSSHALCLTAERQDARRFGVSPAALILGLILDDILEVQF